MESDPFGASRLRMIAPAVASRLRMTA